MKLTHEIDGVHAPVDLAVILQLVLPVEVRDRGVGPALEAGRRAVGVHPRVLWFEKIHF